MNACMVCATYPPNEIPCGVGDYTRELTERLAEVGVGVTVVASAGYRGGSGGTVAVRQLATPWDRDTVKRVVDLVRRERFDLVHVQYTPELYGPGPWPKLLPLLLALGGGPPVVVTPHTLVGGYGLATFLAPLLLAGARRIICPNPEVTSLITRYLPPLRPRIREIPIGSAVPGAPERPDRVRQAIREELGAGAGTMLVAHFGFARPGKGIETLLEAARRLHAMGTRYLLLMIGGAWPGAEAHYKDLKARSHALGLADRVRWLGHADRARVGALLGACDAYVIPYDDGLSTRRSTLITGIAHRLPIVSTRAARPDARFRDGEQALLVPPRDPDALARALVALAASPELRARLRAEMDRLAALFSWPAIVEATRAVYREVLA